MGVWRRSPKASSSVPAALALLSALGGRLYLPFQKSLMRNEAGSAVLLLQDSGLLSKRGDTCLPNALSFCYRQPLAPPAPGPPRGRTWQLPRRPGLLPGEPGAHGPLMCPLGSPILLLLSPSCHPVPTHWVHVPGKDGGLPDDLSLWGS